MSQKNDPDSRVGRVLRDATCPFCGQVVREYENARSAGTTFVEHDDPWCDGYTAFVAVHGKGAEPNPNDEGEEESS